MAVPSFLDEHGEVVQTSANNPFPTSNVVANGSITEDKLSPALDAKINGKVDKAGDNMTGPLDMGSNKIANVTDPTLNQDAATKNYVDAQIAATPTSFNYQGSWDASTNTPALADGSGTVGDLYKVSTAGSQDLGSGSINFAVGDHVVYDGATWENFGQSAQVSSVNGKTGAVVLDSSDVGALPLTGGTLTGDLHMSEKTIVNLADGSNARDAVNKQQLDTKGGLAQANTWTAKQIITTTSGETDPSLALASDNPQFEMRNTSAPADTRRWNWATDENGAMFLRALTDDGETASNVVTVTRTGATADKITLAVNELVWPNSISDGKIRLWNTEASSDFQYYGMGIENGALVYQVDSNTSKHTFRGADQGSDSALPIAEMSSDAGIVSHVPMSMSSNKISSVADPTDAQDVATKAYVDSSITQNQVAHMQDSIATDVQGIVANFNALLQNMQTAGVMAGA